jgi:flagellar assembly protein FliH
MQWRAVGVSVHGTSGSFAPPSGTPAGVAKGEPEEISEIRKQLQACHHQAESQAREAYQKGVQQGEANARQNYAAQNESSLQRLARTIEEISGLRQRSRYAAEQDVVKLALAIARRIVHRELTIDPATILGLVKAALGSMDMRELHRIRIHPGQADTVRRHLETMGLPQRCEVVADPALERGAAILETNHGTLDASVDTQFEEIERGFADLVRHAV